MFYGLPDISSDEEPKQKFEYVILVLLSDSYELTGVYEITWKQFLNYKSWHSRMRAWNLPIRKDILSNAKKVK